MFRVHYPNRPSLGPSLSITKFLCVWSPKRPLHKTVLHFASLLFNILFLIGIYTNLFLLFSYDYFVEFGMYSAFHLGILKTSSYTIRSKDWSELLKIIRDIEDESTIEANKKHAAIVIRYRKYCQYLSICFWIAAIPIVIFLLLFYWLNHILLPDLRSNPLVPYKCIFCSWLPFDCNTRTGRYLSAVGQTIFTVSSCIYTWTWDAMVLSAMVFLIGQLKALRERCVNALETGEDEASYKNIIKCYKHYLAILNMHKIFKSVVSPVMFIHLLQVSINCSICIINMSTHSDNLSSVVTSIDVLFGLNFQLFLFYWIANEVTVQSEKLAYGVFESDWVRSGVLVRRGILMLVMGMRQRMAFTAGPFNEMSLPTFVSILRASYSFYAILSQKD